MGRARYFEVATDTLGRPVPGTVVNVYQVGTTTPIVETIYAADSGGTTLSNPIVANAQGEIEFYLDAPKRVDLRWVKAGYTTESHAADVGSADLYATDAELIGTYAPFETVADLAAEAASRTLQDLPVAAEDIAAYRPGVPSAVLTTPTYDGSGVAVHPSVLYVPDGWGGHRYWMAMTPYTALNAEVENPSILVSNDGYTWSVPAGVTNPLVASPAGAAYNSDPHLTLGPDNRLYLFYRDYGTGAPQQDRLLVMSSADGITWTAPAVIVSTDDSVQRLLSPAMWWDGGANEWVMIAVDIVPSPRLIKRLTAPAATGPWSAAVTVTVTPSMSVATWHLDAHYVNGVVIALLHPTNTGADAGLLLATSADQGRTFTRATATIGSAYRSALVPLLTPSGLAFDVFLSPLAGGMKRVRVQVPAASADSDLKVLRGAFGLSAGVVGDVFNRVDSATTLGTSTSGHAWTNDTGVWGILAQRAYLPTATNSRAVIETSVADGRALMTLAAKGTQAWLVFRFTNSTNYIRYGQHSTGVYYLEKVVAGAVTALVASAVAVVAGDVIEVTYSGSTMTCYVNGVVIGTATDAFNVTATKCGLQTADATTRIENFAVLSS